MSELSVATPGLHLPGETAALDVRAVTADSRMVRPGSLFVAIPGGRADGRAHIGDAVARGAAAVLAPPGTAWPAGVPPRPLIKDASPRQRLAQFAYRLAGPPPARVVAVTGTNGKTSTVEFLRQFWALDGRRAASLGTLGVIGGATATAAGLTTPDPVAMADALAALARDGVTDAAVEASSHGLDQFRLDGLKLAAAAFTNLTRDHLDYHGDLAAYRAAKLRLFAELLPSHGVAVASTTLDPDSRAALDRIAHERGFRLVWAGEGAELLAAMPTADGQLLRVRAGGVTREVALALPGRFQADNVLVAAALAQATGVNDPLASCARLSGVRGRMELAARLANGAAAYVDYAHTPDALERLLTALRPHAQRLVVVFGAGGDRDRGKRPLMGAACARHADLAIVTDDNPRSEDAAAIRAEVRAGCPDAIEIAGRRAAIAAGLQALRPGDVLAVAGKGHEQGQEVAGEILPFDDAGVVRELAA